MAISIHQIFYDPAQRLALDPAFIPHDNTANPCPEWREYHVFRTAWLAGACRGADVTGYVSWKFTAKTGVSGRAFLEFIAANPGHDVYFINPHRVEPRPFANIWQQAEVHHPGIIDLAQRILAAVGLEIDLAHLEQPRDQVLFCNYWAGTGRFWDWYMDLGERVRRQVLTGLDEADRRRAWSRADREIDAPYVPFIMERLFSTLLAIRPEIRYRAWEQDSARPGRTPWYRRRLQIFR
jgi:hypothetical protein